MDAGNEFIFQMSMFARQYHEALDLKPAQHA
jgi:hypothetical protein